MRLLIAILVSLPLLSAQEAKPAAEPKPEEKKEAEAPAPAPEPAISGTLEVGYRATGTAGNFNAYRSVVDLGDGPRLFQADVTVQDPGRRLFDRLDVHANNWGGDPYSTFFANARKQGLYEFRASYRNFAYFNFLPSFANPLLDQGVASAERAFDVHRRVTQVEFDLFPGGRLVPFFAYGRNSDFGRGITTFVGDANEYPVSTDLSNHLDNFRGGLRVEAKRWHVTLEQGGTQLSDDQRVFFSGRNFGNRTTPFQGQALLLANLDENYRIRGDSIYSRGMVTGNPFDWLDLYGQFLYSQPSTTTTFEGNAAGQLARLNPLLLFTAQTEAVSARAKLPQTAANAGFELRPFRRLRIIESWQTNRLHNDSSTVLLQTLFVNANQALPPEAFADRLVFNYNRQQVDALFDLTRHITLRGGHRYEWGDARVGPSSLLPTGQVGELARHVGLAGVTIRAARKLRFNADFEGASASRVYFRPSLADYRLGRVRASYRLLPNLDLGYNFHILSNQNPARGIDYDFLSHNNTVSAQWSPNGGKRVAVLAEYTYQKVRSDLAFLLPQELAPAQSSYLERNHAASALVDLGLPGYASLSPKLTVGGTLYVSGGTRPTSFYQPLVRAVVPLHKNVAVTGEWRYYGFDERFYAFEAFRAHLFQTGLRFTR